MTKKQEIQRLKDLINMLESDIEIFGGSYSDKSRLKDYKKRLEKLIK